MSREGYGICTEFEYEVRDALALVNQAPELSIQLGSGRFADAIEEWGAVTRDAIEDWDYEDSGIGGILREVIEEVEGYKLAVGKDTRGRRVLYLPATFPWDEETKANAGLTLEKLQEVINKYLAIVSQVPQLIVYFEVE